MPDPTIQRTSAARLGLVIDEQGMEASQARDAATDALYAHGRGRASLEQLESALGRASAARRGLAGRGVQDPRLDAQITALGQAVASMRREQAVESAPMRTSATAGPATRTLDAGVRAMRRGGDASRAAHVMLHSRNGDAFLRELGRGHTRENVVAAMQARGLSESRANELADALEDQIGAIFYERVRGEVSTGLRDAARDLRAASMGAGPEFDAALGHLWGPDGEDFVQRLETGGVGDSAIAELRALRRRVADGELAPEDAVNASRNTLALSLRTVAGNVEEALDQMQGTHNASPFAGDLLRTFPETAARTARRMGADARAFGGNTVRGDMVSGAIADLASANEAHRSTQMFWAEMGLSIGGLLAAPALMGATGAAATYATVASAVGRGTAFHGTRLGAGAQQLDQTAAAAAAGLESTETVRARERSLQVDAAVSVVGIAAEAGVGIVGHSTGHSVGHAIEEGLTAAQRPGLGAVLGAGGEVGATAVVEIVGGQAVHKAHHVAHHAIDHAIDHAIEERTEGH